MPMDHRDFISGKGQKLEIARINPSVRPIAPQANQQQSLSPALTASKQTSWLPLPQISKPRPRLRAP
jgi:hypothetical protein